MTDGVSGALELLIPATSLVVLVGASGSGKSTFAGAHFLSTEVVSSDLCRALVSDDETNVAASQDAFDLVRFIARKRLRAGRLTVVDATSVRLEHRSGLIALARDCDVPAVAIVFDLAAEECLARNEARSDRVVPASVVRQQLHDLRLGLPGLASEGFRDVYVLSSRVEVDAAVPRRVEE